MELLPPSVLKRFAAVGAQQQNADPLVIAKYFNPCGPGTWYATEYYSDDQTFYGYVSIFGDYNDEWGYFSLEELKEFKGP